VVLAFLLLVGGILYLLFRPPVVIEQSLSSRNMWHAKALATACTLYASENKDRFPESLSVLSPDYIPSAGANSLQYIVEETKRPPITADWLYFGAGFTDKNPPSILLAAPAPYVETHSKLRFGREFRVYVEGNGTGHVAKEADYQRLLSETLKQTKALPETSDSPDSRLKLRP
jgi:hypothetical protein